MHRAAAVTATAVLHAAVAPTTAAVHAAVVPTVAAAHTAAALTVAVHRAADAPVAAEVARRAAEDVVVEPILSLTHSLASFENNKTI